MSELLREACAGHDTDRSPGSRRRRSSNRTTRKMHSDPGLQDIVKPVIYWVPVIAPGNLMFYKGHLFPHWNGSALISGLASESIVRVTFDGKGGAKAVQRWNMGMRVRDIEEAPDGSLWMLEDASPGGLYHLMPK